MCRGRVSIGVGVRGLEPRASSLSGTRSNRLSYTPEGQPYRLGYSTAFRRLLASINRSRARSPRRRRRSWRSGCRSTDPIVDSAVISTMFSAPSMAVQPRMSDAENQCEMFVPAVFLAGRDRRDLVLQRREDAERGQHHVEHGHGDEQDDERHHRGHEAELHDRPGLQPRQRQHRLALVRPANADLGRRSRLGLGARSAPEGGRDGAREPRRRAAQPAAAPLSPAAAPAAVDEKPPVRRPAPGAVGPGGGGEAGRIGGHGAVGASGVLDQDDRE